MASVGSSMDSLVNQEAPKVVLIENSNKELSSLWVVFVAEPDTKPAIDIFLIIL